MFSIRPFTIFSLFYSAVFSLFFFSFLSFFLLFSPSSGTAARRCFQERPLHSTKNLYLAKMPREKLEHTKEIYPEHTIPDLMPRCPKQATPNANAPTYQDVEQDQPKDVCWQPTRCVSGMCSRPGTTLELLSISSGICVGQIYPSRNPSNF